jgi:hypothetical protein
MLGVAIFGSPRGAFFFAVGFHAFAVGFHAFVVGYAC